MFVWAELCGCATAERSGCNNDTQGVTKKDGMKEKEELKSPIMKGQESNLEWSQDVGW